MILPFPCFIGLSFAALLKRPQYLNGAAWFGFLYLRGKLLIGDCKVAALWREGQRMSETLNNSASTQSVYQISFPFLVGARWLLLWWPRSHRSNRVHSSVNFRAVSPSSRVAFLASCFQPTDLPAFCLLPLVNSAASPASPAESKFVSSDWPYLDPQISKLHPGPNRLSSKQTNPSPLEVLLPSSSSRVRKI